MSIKDILGRLRKGSGQPEQPANEEDKPKVVNGYLQTSNTRVIRPVYSNTKAARAAQEKMKKTSEKTENKTDK